MTTDWTFLERYGTICASFVRDEPINSTTEMEVFFKWPFECNYQRILSCVVDLEEEIPQNVAKLIQIHEAIELLTITSLVDNKAFRERFRHVTHSTRQRDRRWYPSWRLYVRGSVAVQQATWSSLFAFSEASPEFKEAIEKLKVMEVENTSMWYLFNNYNIEWVSKFDGADVVMRTNFGIDKDDMFNRMKTDLAGVPVVKQLGLAVGTVGLVCLWQNQSVADAPMDIRFSITIRDFTTTYSRVLAGLTWLPIRSLKMNFDNENITMTTEILSNRAYRVVCVDYIMNCDKISSSMLAVIYSIQDTYCVPTPNFDPTAIWIFVDLVDSESWPLLVNAICCGHSVRTNLTVYDVRVTNSDLLEIADICRHSSGKSEILHDSKEKNLQVSTEFRYLELFFTEIESGSLVVNLLGLIGRNLRSLTLTVAYSVDMTFDLSELAAVCTNLKYLETHHIHVVVSVHSEALNLWPIQRLHLDNYSKLSDLTSCLRNPNLRMAHELMRVNIREYEDLVNEEQTRGLKLHDGDFLSIRKANVPIWSKAAMVSAVDYVPHTKAIHGLHQDVLSLIFAFASTPATRSVHFWRKDS